MHMKIHTKGIKGSRIITTQEEEPGAMFASILEIDGMLIDMISHARVLHSNDSFTTVMVRFIPGRLETITHTKDSWDELIDCLKAQALEREGQPRPLPRALTP